MLVVKNELDFNGFWSEYEEYLKDIEADGVELIFDSLSDIFYDVVDDITIRDYIRFQLQVQTLKEVLDNYSPLDDEKLEEMSEDEKIEAIENYLNDNTYLLGYYEDSNNEIVFLFDEF